MLGHVLDGVDELEDGVILHFVDNQELGLNFRRLLQVFNLLVADDDFQLQGGLPDVVQDGDDVIVVRLNEVVHGRIRVVVLFPEGLQVFLEPVYQRVVLVVDVQGVDNRIRRRQLMGGEVHGVDAVNHAGNRHGMDVGVFLLDVVGGGVREAQDCDIFRFYAVGNHVVHAAENDG